MSTVQWRPYVNALTTPRSYKPQVIPRDTNGYKKLAKAISRENPLWSADLVESIIRKKDEKVMEMLLNGDQVSLENSFTYHISLAARLNAPDAPLPSPEECVRVKVYAARAFVEEVQQKVQLERLPPIQKEPVLAGAKDTVFRLSDVLNPDGLLRLSGTDLFFDPEEADMGCVIEGTRSGKGIQTRFGPISNSEVLVMPDIPAQDDPWNNEYQVSINTHYTEHGSLRTGTYARMLRTPLSVPITGSGGPPANVGILTGKEASPHVSVTGGSTSADETLRIQVILDARADALLFSLLDMKEDGMAGTAVSITANGAVTLQGFSGSALTSLGIQVNEYAALKDMIRNNYGDRLVDILNIETA